MIIVRLIGGLGNQLFQYAMARHVAEIHRALLKIDVSEFEIYKLHEYSLQHFGILENLASAEELCAVQYLKEKHFHFDGDFKAIGDNVLLKGYWQTEKYFREIADTIRNECVVKKPLDSENLRVAQCIDASNAVAVHIRRCDYLPATYGDQIIESLPLEYYLRAIAMLSRVEKDLHFFIFSDDPEWVKENVRLEYPIVYVAHNTAATNYEDLRLMSLCKHNIIANSSFSWWGAWLNKNPNKRVYAPKQWFNANVRNLDSKDLIPESWIKI